MGFDEGQLRRTCLGIELKIKPVFIIWSEKSGPIVSAQIHLEHG